jgi:cellulose biosynthesis protein BcsQ
MRILALHNLKGGVGKTTAAVHLAHLSARAGRATLLWDLDAQGAASWILRVRVGADTRPRRLLRDRQNLWEAIRGSDWPALDVLPADLSLRKLETWLHGEEQPVRAFERALLDLSGRYECVVLDCPPGLSSLTACVFEVADALAVPTIPSTLSLRALASLHQHLEPQRERGLQLLPFLSMVDTRKAMHRHVRDFVRAKGLGFLVAEIPYSAQVENVAARRLPLTIDGGPPAAQDFEVLAREIEARLDSGAPGPKLGRSRLQEFLEDAEASAAQRSSSS